MTNDVIIDVDDVEKIKNNMVERQLITEIEEKVYQRILNTLNEKLSELQQTKKDKEV